MVKTVKRGKGVQRIAQENTHALPRGGCSSHPLGQNVQTLKGDPEADFASTDFSAP